MKTLFWIFFVLALLELGYLLYHFTTYEHTPVPSEPAVAGYAESLRVYQAKLADLEQNAEQARARLDQVGKSEWPSVHLRLQTADEEIGHLRSVMKRWEEVPSAAGLSELYHEAVSVYGRAAGLVLAATYDTLPGPETGR